MNIPTWREWLYSAKSLIAALLALYIALAIPLDNPYWAMASVYIVAHPLSGATRSKAIYRSLGTLLGAAASVALMPLFVHQPVMQSLVIALWVGLLLYLSLLDRTPRSYIFMLSAYTVPLISLSQVNQPEAIFDVALARFEEITLGILCAAVVNAVVFPSKVAPVLGARMDTLLGDARKWIASILAPQSLGDSRALNKLLADVMLLDGMILHLSYDSASHLAARHAREFRARMAMLAPQVVSLADPLGKLREEFGELPQELAELLVRLEQWLQGDAEEQAARRLREHSQHLETWLCDTHPAQALLIGSALGRLRDLILLWQDCLNLRQSFASGQGEPQLGYKVNQLLGGPRHYDHLLLAFSAGSVGLSVFVACLIWMSLGWDYGFSGIFLAAVVGCFFATQDNPAPFIRSFLFWTVVSTVAAGIYLFGLMPFIHDFGMLATALAVPLLLVGTLGGRPQFSAAVMLFAVQTISTITIQDSYKADFPLFADLAVSNVLGLVFALVWARVTKPFGAEWAARRLARSTWSDLAELAMAGGRDPMRTAAQMIDRTNQLLPRLSQVRDPRLALTDASRDLRICFRLLELQQRRLPAPLRRLVRPVQEAVRDYYLACVRARHQLPPPDSLLERLDDCLGQLPLTSGRALKTAQTLTGLRLALFPQQPRQPAAAPVPPPHGPVLAGAQA